MSHIIRGDGTRFIVPNYRDIIVNKRPTLLRREIIMLTSTHGSYITLQRKNTQQWEAAFSNEAGYLLGETVWHFFKRIPNLIYCEVLENNNEAILVVVINGSVQLDGVFPVNALVEELIVYQTQAIAFEFNVFGDVPFTNKEEASKVRIPPTSIKTFNSLTTSVYKDLQKLRVFQLAPVQQVLKTQGIGSVPIKTFIAVFVGIGVIWMLWDYFKPKEEFMVVTRVPRIQKYAAYQRQMASSFPSVEMHNVALTLVTLTSMPGWKMGDLVYENKTFKVHISSLGAAPIILANWALMNNAQINIEKSGFVLLSPSEPLPNREVDNPSNLQIKLYQLIERLNLIIPGNPLTIESIIEHPNYQELPFSIAVTNITPMTLDLIGQQLAGLPLVLTSVTLNVNQSLLTGTINLSLLGR